MANDPKVPLRRDLEEMCRGNHRLAKEFEQLFRFLPTEIEDSKESNSDAQFAADSAAAQAQSALGLYGTLSQLVELLITQPQHICNCQTQQDFAVRTEHMQENLIICPVQIIEQDNLYLEVI
ncbi:TPA: hypothetical protein ACIFDR_003556 [Acinetobacter baumannii]